MIQKTPNKNAHVIRIDLPLFEEVFEGRHTVLLVDSTPSTSKIRSGESIIIEPEPSGRALKLPQLEAEVLEIFIGETYADVLRMLPPDDVTVHGSGPLALMKRLETFYQRESKGESFGILGIRFRIVSESAVT